MTDMAQACGIVDDIDVNKRIVFIRSFTWFYSDFHFGVKAIQIESQFGYIYNKKKHLL